MMDDEDDLFAIFGDAEDTEYDNNKSISKDDKSLLSRAEKLMTNANSKRIEKSKIITETVKAKRDDEKRIDLLSKFQSYKLPWDPPLYLGPITCVSSAEYGGGRTYVATNDLKPGTLIMIEEPIIDWPEEQIGKELGLISIRHIFQLPRAQKILHDLEAFHPTKESCDKFLVGDEQVRGIIERLEKELSDDELSAVVTLAKGFRNRDGSSLSKRDIIRLLVALRYNGFQSGVYLHLAMVNHSCFPNSVKFVPTKSYSEVRTTRYIKAGESITISYLPRIASYPTRRYDLWEQHLFDFNVPNEFKVVELIGGVFPTSSLDKKDKTSLVTFRIEDTIEALEDRFQDAASALALDQSMNNPIWEEIKALELAALEVYTEARNQLQNNDHILLLPCLRLHLDACDLVQVGKFLNPKQNILLLLRILKSATRLVKIQTKLYGKDHFDLARTYNEISQTIAELLSTAPNQMIELGLENMNSFSSCSAKESFARSEFERIKNLYPTDAESHIKNKLKD